ncbi:MAG: glutathione S-transferase N-terminal domain-containing protein [Pseudomonadales bacterium]
MLNIVSSALATFVRPGIGISVEPAAEKPVKMLELYDMEGCPFCRITREALTELDIDAVVYPCPKKGTRFRPKVIEMGGKAQFPYLVDHNTGTQIYESVDTVAYLYETYGQRPVPLKWRAEALQKIGSSLASALRPGFGLRLEPSSLPEKMLELYSFESSPFARLVREKLTELEIPYILRNAGRTTWKDWVPPGVRESLGIESEPELVNRQELQERAGKIAIPYLIDPNTGTELFESGQIVEYLDQTYGA